jgi:glycosyltransferase involved in cell wall biosynthesis
LPAADQVWATSPADRGHYLAAGRLRDVAVVPNVVDPARYPAGLAPEEPDAVVFPGTFTYLPNEDAAHALLGMAARLAARGVGLRLYLVGRSPSPRLRAAVHGRAEVVLTGEVPDARPYLARAAVVAAPLAAGSGTKLKVLEALALGRAVVTTPIGAEGLGIVDGREALIAEPGPAFDDAVVALLADPVRRAALGAAGRARVEAAFGPAALDRAVRAAFASLGLMPSGDAPAP